MKKLFIALMFLGAVIASLESKAQNVLFVGTASDTLVNSGTETVTFSAASSFAYKTTVFMLKVTKLTGTIGGTCLLKVSNNATATSTDPTAYGYITHPTADTITLGNATTTYSLKVTDDGWKNYQISCTGNNTGTALLSGNVYFKRP